MLQRLRVECGHNTVNKLAQMMNDINLSKNLMEEYRGGETGDGGACSEGLQVEVLTNGHWSD